MKEAIANIHGKRLRGEIIKSNPKTVWMSFILSRKKLAGYSVPREVTVKRHRVKHHVIELK